MTNSAMHIGLTQLCAYLRLASQKESESNEAGVIKNVYMYDRNMKAIIWGKSLLIPTGWLLLFQNQNKVFGDGGSKYANS